MIVSVFWDTSCSGPLPATFFVLFFQTPFELWRPPRFLFQEVLGAPLTSVFDAKKWMRFWKGQLHEVF